MRIYLGIQFFFQNFFHGTPLATAITKKKELKRKKKKNIIESNQ